MLGDSYFKSQVPCFLESEELAPLTQAGGGREYLALREMALPVICKRSLVGTINVREIFPALFW